MILKTFTVYDDKAEAYLAPFFVPTAGVAVRTFRDCANSESHHFGQNPADYTLFEIGEFDDATAIFKAYDSFKNLGTALSYQNHEDIPDKRFGT